METISPNIVSLNSKNIFNLKEANELAVLLKKITEKYQEKLNQLLQQIDNEGCISTKEGLKAQAQLVVDAWNSKVTKLGVKPSGIWFADMDFGEGYYCWKFPEDSINYWHKHTEGFTKRRLIENSH